MKRAFLAAVLAATAGLAAAQTMPPPGAPGPRPGHGLLRADRDRDGIVTRTEAIALADRRFDRIDTDHDGRMTAAERTAAHAAKQARREMRRGDVDSAPTPPAASRPTGGDRDGDGVVTREEFRAKALRRFDRIDADRDGRIAAGELAALPHGPGHAMAPPPDGAR